MRQRRTSAGTWRAWLIGGAVALLVIACGGGAASGGGSSSERYGSPVTNIQCHGCGDGVTLNVWFGKASASTAQGQVQLQQYMSKRFESLTGAKVQWTPWFSATDEVNKLNGAVTSHNGPDVFEMGDTFVPSAAKGGALAHLSPSDWNLVGGRQRFFPTQLKLSGPASENWSSVPEFMNPYGMTYNTHLFQEAGIAGPPKTWSDFITDAQKISRLGDGVSGTALFPADSFQSWKLMYLMTEQMAARS
jgi:multiple sugar transport system substrate-binding protein